MAANPAMPPDPEEGLLAAEAIPNEVEDTLGRMPPEPEALHNGVPNDPASRNALHGPHRDLGDCHPIPLDFAPWGPSELGKFSQRIKSTTAGEQLLAPVYPQSIAFEFRKQFESTPQRRGGGGWPRVAARGEGGDPSGDVQEVS